MSVGLLDLVDAAAAAARKECPDAGPLIDEVCRQCLGGQYAWAVGTSFPDGLFIPEEWRGEYPTLHRDPGWVPFHRTVQFAADVESFLYLMERSTPVLARDCRRDLDLLGVLADWCEDAGLPHSAAEARYHAEQVRLWRRGPLPLDHLPEGGGEDDRADGEWE